MSDEREFTIDWPHGHQLRDGRKARIVCSDLRGGRPLAVAVTDVDGEEFMTTRRKDGRCAAVTPSFVDLLNAPAPKQTRWVNVYPEMCYSSRESADEAAAVYRPDDKRFACIEVSEGDGLDEG